MVSVAPIITGIAFVFTFRMGRIPVVMSLYFTRFFFIITDYDVRFVVRDGCVDLHLLFPQYGYFAFVTYFC
jgi:hypothetical protein